MKNHEEMSKAKDVLKICEMDLTDEIKILALKAINSPLDKSSNSWTCSDLFCKAKNNHSDKACKICKRSRKTQKLERWGFHKKQDVEFPIRNPSYKPPIPSPPLPPKDWLEEKKIPDIVMLKKEELAKAKVAMEKVIKQCLDIEE